MDAKDVAKYGIERLLKEGMTGPEMAQLASQVNDLHQRVQEKRLPTVNLIFQEPVHHAAPATSRQTYITEVDKAAILLRDNEGSVYYYDGKQKQWRRNCTKFPTLIPDDWVTVSLV